MLLQDQFRRWHEPTSNRLLWTFRRTAACSRRSVRSECWQRAGSVRSAKARILASARCCSSIGLAVSMSMCQPWSIPFEGFACRLSAFERKFYWSFREGGSKREGCVRHLGEPREALGNTREYWEVLSYLPPLPQAFHKPQDPKITVAITWPGQAAAPAASSLISVMMHVKAKRLYYTV